jgi:predicted nucleic-acid-binding Zn-ribbon protein
MSDNPLSQYFRQPGAYVKLPTQGIWYQDGSVKLTDEGEIAVYPLSAIDDILLNTPDAMLNGQALEKVVKNCVPDVKDVKKLMIPDLDVIFIGMKSASNQGKFDLDRKCAKCGHENTYEINCNTLLATSTFIDPNETKIKFNEDLEVHVKPYSFEMRQLFIKKEFDEEKLLRAIDEKNTSLDEIEKAKILGESIDRLSKVTFDLVSKSIDKIVMIKQELTITDKKHINEWLLNITKAQSDMVVEAVNKLNAVGVNKTIPITCENCGNTVEETLNFDPASFFVKRS